MEKFKGYIYLFCAFVFAGTSVISARFVSGKLGVFTIAAASLFFALMVLLPLSRKKLIAAAYSLSVKGWISAGLQALFGIFLFRMFLLNGLLHTSTAEAGIMTGAIPAVTAVLAWAVLKEKIRAKNAGGIASTVFGILLIQGLLSHTYSPEHFVGNMLVFCAAASESVFNILSRISAVKMHKKEAFDPLVQTTLVCIIAFVLCLIPALFEQPIKAVSAIGIAEWLALFWYGVFVTALAFIFWYAGIKRCAAHIAAAFSGMMPFTSLILSVTVLGETALWHQWAGAMLVILGMVLIGYKKRPQIRSRG